MKYRGYQDSLIELIKFSELNLEEVFFSSLRNDYNPGFDDWFAKKQRTNQKAFVYKNSKTNLVEGFLYLKIEDEFENYINIIDGFEPKKRLKVGTFKIAHVGKRMGQKFIQIICDHSLLNEISEIYITVFENDGDKAKIQLINLLKKFNFKYHSQKKDTLESVFVKKISGDKELNCFELYPLVEENAQVYVHFSNKNEQIIDFNKIYKNSIHKYHIENNLSESFSPKEKDIILFLTAESFDENNFKIVMSAKLGSIIRKSKIHQVKINDLLKESIPSQNNFLNKLTNKEVVEFLHIDEFNFNLTLNDLKKLKIFSYNNYINEFKKISNKSFSELLNFANYRLNKRG